MGPGYVPRVLSITMIVLGIYVSATSWRKAAPTVEWPRMRPFLIVVAAPVLFGLLVEPLGLVATILVVTAVARLAEPQRFSWDAIIMPLVMVVFCVIVFVELIGLPISLWP
jgi:putative tricarboxylic transport membrane protein